MYPLAGIAGGFLATIGIMSLAVSGPASLKNLSSVLTNPVTNTADQLDRARKGDRLTRLPDTQEPRKVSTVEVVGVRDTAVIYRDREGRILFRTDPVENVTIVAKGVKLPDVTVRESSNAVPTTLPVKTLQEDDRSQRMIGCDPLVSPLASSSLSRVAGRCIAGLGTGEKLATLMPQ